MAAEFADLLARAQRGDASAVDALVSRNLQGLRAFVRLRSGPNLRRRESDSDLVQSVLREVLVDLGDARCNTEGAFKSWLFSVALHKILHKVEFHEAQRRDVKKESPFDDAHALLTEGYHALRSPSQDAAAKEEIERIEAAFDRLTDAERDIVLQVRILGRSFQELADESGATPESLRQRLSRARARLGLLLTP